MTPLDAMKQALEALEAVVEITLIEHQDGCATVIATDVSPKAKEAITTITSTIAELESAEPVAWWDRINDGGLYGINVGGWCEPLFTHPAQPRDSIIEECAEKLISLGVHEFYIDAIRALKGE